MHRIDYETDEAGTLYTTTRHDHGGKSVYAVEKTERDGNTQGWLFASPLAALHCFERLTT